MSGVSTQTVSRVINKRPDVSRETRAAVERLIAETGFQGYFAHEFIPVRDPLTSLREAVTLCDV